MQIPKSYKCMGRTIKIKLVPVFDVNGLAMLDENEIILLAQPAREKMEHVFLHESLHHWLHILGHHELCQDEALVNSLSGLMHQMLVTQKGELI